MFAVIKTGGKQYRVAADDVLEIERLEGETGDVLEIGDVLMVGVGKDVTVGAPFVEGALVTAEIIEQNRGPKVISFKKRRRQNSKRIRGHRQLLSTVRITEILTGGAKPAKKAKAAKPAAVEPVAAEEAMPAAALAATASESAEPVAEKPAKAKKAKAETAPEAAAAVEALETAAPEAAEKPKAAKGKSKLAQAELSADAPKPLFKAPKGKGDDLTALNGVGPKAMAELVEDGITTFKQIAELTDAEIDVMDARMPFSANQIRQWREESKELAK